MEHFCADLQTEAELIATQQQLPARRVVVVFEYRGLSSTLSFSTMRPEIKYNMALLVRHVGVVATQIEPLVFENELCDQNIMPVLTVLSAPPWVFIGAMSCSFPSIIHMRGAAPSALLAAIDVGSPYACRTSREASANGALTLITLKGFPVCLSMIAVPSRSM